MGIVCLVWFQESENSIATLSLKWFLKSTLYKTRRSVLSGLKRATLYDCIVVYTVN